MDMYYGMSKSKSSKLCLFACSVQILRQSLDVVNQSGLRKSAVDAIFWVLIFSSNVD